VAQQLNKLGIVRVRPLQGGFHGWKDLGYPLAEPTEIAWHFAASVQGEAG
jgi:3-mercaptopyruvate sulfurtransferase SseA